MTIVAKTSAVVAKKERLPSGDLLSMFFAAYFVENLNTVFEWNDSPGFRIVVGKSGWFGESGKCCVSRQRP